MDLKITFGFNHFWQPCHLEKTSPWFNKFHEIFQFLFSVLCLWIDGAFHWLAVTFHFSGNGILSSVKRHKSILLSWVSLDSIYQPNPPANPSELSMNFQHYWFLFSGERSYLKLKPIVVFLIKFLTVLNWWYIFLFASSFYVTELLNV